MQLQCAFIIGLLVATPAVSQSTINSLTGSESSTRLPEKRQTAPTVVDALDQSIDRLIDKFRRGIGVRSAADTEWDSNASPRETVFTFVQGMNEQLYHGTQAGDKVAQTLPAGYTSMSEEAIALKSVFDRLGDIQPSDLPPDNASVTQKSNQFEVFPYAVDHEWVWKQLSAPPNGEINLSKNSDGHWRFTEATLNGAIDLLESMKSIPPTYDGVNRKLFLPSLYTSPWWTWLVAGAGLVVAFFVGRKSRSYLIGIGDSIEKKTKPIIGSLFRSIATSIAILLGTTIFIIGSAFVELSPAISNIYWQCIKVVLLIALVWVLFGLTDLAATLIRYHVVQDNHEYGEMTVTIIQRIIRTFLFVMIAIFMLENVFGFSIGALLTGLGIIGLALSLAGKETAQNLFGAISIFVNRPFVVGDWIEFKDQIGEVADVRMQATHIRLLSGEMLIVPNMQFISNEVENLAMRKYLRREMNISVPYATEPEQVDQAVEILDKILRSEEIVTEGMCNLDERPPIISFSEFGDYYLNLKVYYWYFIGKHGEALQRNSERGWFSYLEHCTLVNRTILKAFNDEGIKFAFPTQTLAIGRADEGTLSN